MRLFRTKNIKSAIFDLGSKLLLLAVTALVCLWMVSGAKAAVPPRLNDIRQLPDGTVELVLSSDIHSDQIEVDYQRNFVQFSLHGVNAFPAKSAHLNAPSLDKAFTYQYQPDLARARILFTESANKLKDKASWKIEKNKIIFRLGALVAEEAIPAHNAHVALVSDKVKTKASATEKSSKSLDKSTGPISYTAKSVADKEEDKIVQDILAGKPVITANANSNAANTSEKKESITGNSGVTTAQVAAANGDDLLFKDSHKIGSKDGVKSSGSNPITKMFTGLLTVIALMAAIAYGFKKFILRRNLSFGGNGRIIDVVSTHMLGAKKSISLVKIAGQYMVIGVTDANINLLTSLGAEANIDKYLDEHHFGGNFDRMLGNKLSSTDETPAATGPIASRTASASTQSATSAAANGIRGMIKKRMESLKPL